MPEDPSILQDNVYLYIDKTRREEDFPGELVNSSAMEFIIPNITMKYTNAHIWCCYGNCSKNSSVLSLAVHDIPEPVFNFECVVYNYYDGMNCSWELGKNYNRIINIDVKWRLPQRSGDWSDCPNLGSERMSCIWHGTSNGDYTDKSVQINITITSPYCKDSPAVSLYNISAENIVKPAKAKQLDANAVNSTCINLSWVATHPERLKRHKVTWISRWDDIAKVDTLDDVESPRNPRKSMLICNLHPSTTYTFTVSMMPNGSGFWSDEAVHTAKTESSLPNRSPEVKAGSFRWNPHTCNHYVLVDLYWKGLPEFDQNGELKSYVITKYPHSRPNNSESYEQPRHSFKLKEHALLCNESYDFKIQARNEVGLSPNPSAITITRPDKAPQIPKFMLDLLDGWLAITLLEKKTVNYTLFWCTKNKSNCDDDNSLTWVTLNETETILNFTNPGKNLYGVSITTEAGSSGLDWQNCINIRGAKPTKKPESVKVKPGNQDNSLYVSWDSLSCQPNEPIIVEYIVTFCKVMSSTVCSDKRSLNVSNSASYEIQGLDKDQNYSVTVAGISKEGDIGPESDPVYAVPVDRSLKDKVLVMIVVFAIIGGILLIGLGILFIKCKKKMKVKYALPPIPTLLNENGFENKGMDTEKEDKADDAANEDDEKENQKLFGRQFSGDSGVITDPSSPTSLGSYNNSFSKPEQKQNVKPPPNDYVRAIPVPKDQQVALIAHVQRAPGDIHFIQNGLVFQQSKSGYSKGLMTNLDDVVLPMRELQNGNFSGTTLEQGSATSCIMFEGLDGAGNKRDKNFNNMTDIDHHKPKANDDYVALPEVGSGHSKDYSKAFVEAHERDIMDWEVDNIDDPGKLGSLLNKMVSKATDTELKLEGNTQSKVDVTTGEMDCSVVTAGNMQTNPSDDYVDQCEIFPNNRQNIPEGDDVGNIPVNDYVDHNEVSLGFTKATSSDNNVVFPNKIQFNPSDGYISHRVITPRDDTQPVLHSSHVEKEVIIPGNTQSFPSDGYVESKVASPYNTQPMPSDSYVDHSVVSPGNTPTMTSDGYVDHNVVPPGNTPTMPSDGYVDHSVVSPDNTPTVPSDGYVDHRVVSPGNNQIIPFDSYVDHEVVSPDNTRTIPSDGNVDHSVVSPGNTPTMPSDGCVDHSAVSPGNTQTMPSNCYVDHSVASPGNTPTMPSDGYVDHSVVSPGNTQTMPSNCYVDHIVVSPGHTPTMPSDGYVDHSVVSPGNTQTMPSNSYVDHDVVSPGKTQTMPSNCYVDHSVVSPGNTPTMPSDGYVDHRVVSPGNNQIMPSDSYFDHEEVSPGKTQTNTSDSFVDHSVVSPGNTPTMPSGGYVDHSVVSPGNTQTMPSNSFVDHSVASPGNTPTMPSDSYVDDSVVSPDISEKSYSPTSDVHNEELSLDSEYCLNNAAETVGKRSNIQDIENVNDKPETVECDLAYGGDNFTKLWK